MTDGAFAYVQRRTPLQRAVRALYPYRSLPPLEDFPGSVTTDVTVHLCWRDRLRLLVRPRLVVSVRAYTELPTGRAMRTDVAVYVPPPGADA